MTSSFSTRHHSITLVAIGITLAYLYGLAVLNGVFWQLGQDSDDTMRYVQIRDWLNGQSWYDTNQYRLGLSAGTDMHWSRLPDLPVAMLTWFFDIFVDRDLAFRLAIAIWPPILGAILLLILARGAALLSGERTRKSSQLMVLLLGIIYICLSSRFNPGSLDHHNIQLVLLALVVVTLLPSNKFPSSIMAGVAAGTAFAIGPEVYPFIAIIGIFVALDWVSIGAPRRIRAQGFGIGFAASLTFIFLVTTGPKDFMTLYCDQLSIITVILGVISGLGLATAATLVSEKALLIKIISLGLIGLTVFVILFSAAPQCLGNPLNDLPPDMHTYWLDHITEAKSLIGQDDIFTSVSYYQGTGIIALLVIFHRIWRGGLRSHHVLFALLLVLSTMLTLYQTRFFIFSQLFAILPLGLWVAACYETGKSKKQNLGYIGALALSIPLTISLPAIIFEPTVESKKTAIECLTPDVIAAYAALPKGTVLARTTDGSELVKSTEHHVIAANYHRNVEGIGLSISINSADPSSARDLMQTHNINYLGTCDSDILSLLYEEAFPNSLAAKLRQGESFNWLTPLDAKTELKNEHVHIYKVGK